MCLAVPMQVVKITGDSAMVEYEGTRREVRLDLVDPKPVVGDYVIIHAGFVLHLIDEEEAQESLKTWKEILSDAHEAPE